VSWGGWRSQVGAHALAGAMPAAVQAIGINKHAKCYTLRHSQWLRHAGLRPGKANHLLEHGYDTTMIYTHVLNRGVLGVKSPADLLFS
jgi:hypothetical protein